MVGSNPRPTLVGACVLYNVHNPLLRHWLKPATSPSVLVYEDVYPCLIARQIKGSVADIDGQLVPGDQILVVNGIDVRSSQQQETAALLKVSGFTVVAQNHAAML